MKNRATGIIVAALVVIGMLITPQMSVFADVEGEESIETQSVEVQEAAEETAEEAVEEVEGTSSEEESAAAQEESGEATEETEETVTTQEEANEEEAITTQEVVLDKIYLNPASGNDENTGEEESPVKGLEKALELATENDADTIVVLSRISDLSGTVDLKGLTLERGVTSSAMIQIESGQDVTLTNGVIDGLKKDTGSSLISVQAGGKLVVGEDMTVRNGGNASKRVYNGGGVYVTGEMILDGGTIEGNYASNMGGGIYVSGSKGHNAKLTINSGSIQKNVASVGGGGVFIYMAGECTMNDGQIKDNATGNAGGGVGTWDTWSTGYYDHKPYADASYPENYPAAFTLNGGTISGNSANNGGGIYVASNHVSLNAGTLENNRAGNLGGGVYVASIPYVMHVSRALVTENTAAIGGGLWFCPTGSTTIVVNDGSAIFGNQASGAADDLAVVRYNSSQTLTTLSDRMLGGGLNNWHQDGAINGSNYGEVNSSVLRYADAEEKVKVSGVTESTDTYALVNCSTEAARALADAKHTLTIRNNSAWRGGGIGSNGGAIFGSVESPTKNLNVKKVWDTKENKDAIIPESIDVELISGEHVLETVTLSEENDWSYTFEGLPEDEDVAVREVEVQGWNSSLEKIVSVADENNVITVDVTIINTFIEEEPEEPTKPEEPTEPEKPENPEESDVLGESEEIIPPPEIEEEEGEVKGASEEIKRTAKKTESPKVTSVASRTVRTGDNTNTALWIVLALAAILGGCVAIGSRRKIHK